MSEQEKCRWWLAILAMICVAFILGTAIKASNRSLKEADETIAEADRFIANYERNTEYEFYKVAKSTTEEALTEQATVETEQGSQKSQQVEISVESYGDPTTALYEAENLSMESFYWCYYNMEQPTWEDCVKKASTLGMDEYSLTVMAGWIAREGYTDYDPYLSFLCAMCPVHYWSEGWNIGYGLSGFGSDPSYTDENLIGYSYGITDNELKILYLALTYPVYYIYGCDGVSHYGYGCIYSSWVEGYNICVWAH